MGRSIFKSVAASATILVLGCFALAYFLTVPQWNKYKSSKTHLASMKSDNLRLNDSKKSLQSFLDSFKSKQEAIAGVNLALPLKTPDTPNLIANIENLAHASGLLLSSISVNESELNQKSPENAIQTVTVNMGASGSFPGFKNFILRLEQNLRILDIGHVNLKADVTGGLIQYQITLQTYYQK